MYEITRLEGKDSLFFKRFPCMLLLRRHRHFPLLGGAWRQFEKVGVVANRRRQDARHRLARARAGDPLPRAELLHRSVAEALERFARSCTRKTCKSEGVHWSVRS